MQLQTLSTQTVTNQATESEHKQQYLEGDRQTESHT